MKAVVIERKEDNDSYIKRASQMLKSSLKKGDVIVTKPRLNNIKLKIMHFPSFIIIPVIAISCSNDWDIGSIEKVYHRTNAKSVSIPLS